MAGSVVGSAVVQPKTKKPQVVVASGGESALPRTPEQLQYDIQLAELRQLLLAPYLAELMSLRQEVARLQQVQHQLTDLETRLEDHQALLDLLTPIISEAIQEKIRNSRDEMADALAPIMGQAIKTQVRDAREDIIDALYPVIGRTITKALSEAVQGLVANIDQSVKRTFSFGGLKRKVKSKVTGIPEGALVLREALPFSITEAFLIHTESGLLISHVLAQPLLLGNAEVSSSTELANVVADDTGELVSGMLTAIRDFVRDSFNGRSGLTEHSELNQIQYGGLTILLEPSRYAYLAVVYSGIAPTNFPGQVREMLSWIHEAYGRLLRNYDGNNQPLAKVKVLLADLLLSHTRSGSKPT